MISMPLAIRSSLIAASLLRRCSALCMVAVMPASINICCVSSSRSWNTASLTISGSMEKM